MKYYEDFNEFIEFSNQNELNNKYINKFTEYKNKVLNYFNFYKNLLLSTTYFNIIQNLFDKIYKMLLLIDYQYYIEIFNNKFQIIIEFIITYLDNIVLIKNYKNKLNEILKDFDEINNDFKNNNHYVDTSNEFINQIQDISKMENLFNDMQFIQDFNNNKIQEPKNLNEIKKLLETIPLDVKDSKNPPSFIEIEKLMSTMNELKKISEEIDVMKLQTPDINQFNKAKLRKLKRKQKKKNLKK